MTTTYSARDFAAAADILRENALPLEIDDGTRITCIALAGGLSSPGGVPSHLLLKITVGGQTAHVVRYFSEKAIAGSPNILESENTKLRDDLATAKQTIRNLLDTPDDLESRVLALLEREIKREMDRPDADDRLDRTEMEIQSMIAYAQMKSARRWEVKIKDGVDSIERRIERMVQAMAEHEAVPKKPPAKSKKVVGKKRR